MMTGLFVPATLMGTGPKVSCDEGMRIPGLRDHAIRCTSHARTHKALDGSHHWPWSHQLLHAVCSGSTRWVQTAIPALIKTHHEPVALAHEPRHIPFCSSSRHSHVTGLPWTQSGASSLADTARGLMGSHAGRWPPLLLLAWSVFPIRTRVSWGHFRFFSPTGCK